MNSSMGGTSIQDLHRREKNEQYESIRKQQEMQNMQYGAMQNLQYEQGHNAAHSIQQAQHDPYYALNNGPKYPQNPPTMHGSDMEDLARDISDNLPTDNFIPGFTEFDEDSVVKQSGGVMGYIPSLLREPLIILVLYVVLSQAFVYKTVGKYIPQINPDGTGEVSFYGVIIYGLLLAITYALAKRFLLE
jgi:hypothetical protein